MIFPLRSRILAIRGVLAALATATSALAADSIKLIVGFPAGGGVDLVARQLAPHLARELGAAVTVENVTGEAGNRAAREVARATPDGRTLLVVNPAVIAINPALYPHTGFDSAKDFAPVARLVVTPLLALIPASLSPQNMGEFLTRLRTQKNLKYASGGVGNINHLAIELFKLKSQTRLTHVPAATSSAALTELLEGRVQMMADGGHVAGKHVREGRIRVLAAFSETRLRAMPDVPTAAEAGIPGVIVSSWLGLVAPAATPPAAIGRVQAAVQGMLARAEIAAELAGQGTEPAFLPAGEFRQFIVAEQKKWAEVVAEAGVKLP
jgi:tripartite-type tricarboxylate transporter receptor subunit TctC